MKKSILFLQFLLLSVFLSAQITTASLSGLVTDESGEPLIGATITAVHTPSQSSYGVITQANGRYNIPNMRAGGPYSVSASYIGYSADPMSGVFLELGQKLNLNVTMSESGVIGEEIVITGALDPILNGERTGAETTINRDQLSTLPTISRSSADYTRLNPMAAEGGSFAGRNDQFNNYSLDGSIFNNPFGLDAATPGGQTDAQPIPLDAIEQINVSIAPYDVTQSGFTGAAINAVTRSGSNTFTGSAYTFFRNKDFIGSKVDGEDAIKGDLKQLQSGFSLGGPIVKNKVFFFANVELEQRSDLGSFFVPNSGSTGSNVSRVQASDMQLVSNLLKDRYDYETGAIENFTHDADNVKGIFKLDFNLSQNHKLTATYNFLDAFKDKPAHPSAIGRRGPDFTTLQMQNSGYRINNKIHSGIVELRSFFGNNISNKAQVGYTVFNDARDAFSSPFPVLNIGKDGQRYIIAGHEPFSINNRLDQKVFQFTNDVTMVSGNNTFTIGTSFERFEFDNSFNLGAYGGLVFAPDIDMADFPDFINSGGLDDAVATAQSTFETNNAEDTWALAESNLGQWSLYVQDEILINPDLTVTLGLRMDMPLYFNTPDLAQENIDRNCCYDPNIEYYDEDGNAVYYDHTEFPSSTPLINPRIGFNYNMSEGAAQLRGGTGFFSGRFPFVWVGNQVANPNFFFYTVTDPDFKYPQIWRTNIGYDRKLENGWVLSTDFVYTKDLQAHMVQNHGLKLPTGQLSGVDNRNIYLPSDRATVFGGPTNAYVFTNATTGNSMNISIKGEKRWGNNYMMLAYNFLDSKDAASIDAEISSDGYDRNPANINHTNDAELAPSLYGNRHRILGAASKKFEYGGKWATTISVFMEYVEGNRYSYTYNGDINNDGSVLNDLLYIPTDSEIDQMAFTGDAGAQRAAFKAYINQDDYLSANRGKYAEKYGSLSPWYNHWDIRILQDLKIPNGNTIQFSMDLLNAGNLISSSWGVRQFATQTGLAQPLAVSVADGVPTYTFDQNLNSTFFNDFSTLSRWQLQFGLRYSF